MGARKRRGRSSKREGNWGGIQVPLTNIVVAGNFFDLGETLTAEERERTCVGVRGWMTFANSGSDSTTGGVLCAAKLVAVNLNDALAITDDIQGIDTNLEDIQFRQLWTFHDNLAVASTLNSHQFAGPIEIDVRVKIKLPMTSKRAFGMLIDANIVNRLQFNCYLRAYYKFG